LSFRLLICCYCSAADAAATLSFGVIMLTDEWRSPIACSMWILESTYCII
jgi:hypothetical protein